ncbi:MAG: hypothetical protein P8Z49_06955 [Acidobacteriota bacterium]
MRNLVFPLDWDAILEPYVKLVTILVLGRPFQVPENNLLLRCLQFIAPEHIPYGDFCWAADCLNCRCRLHRGGREYLMLPCQNIVQEGDEIVQLSQELVLALRDLRLPESKVLPSPKARRREP